MRTALMLVALLTHGVAFDAQDGEMVEPVNFIAQPNLCELEESVAWTCQTVGKTPGIVLPRE